MIGSEKSTPARVEQLLQIAGREDVHLEDLVADDVDSDQEHAVGDQLGPDDLGDAQFGLADLDRLGLAAGVDVRADVVLGRDPAQRGIFAVDLSGTPFIRKKRMSPFLAAGT